MIHKNFFLLKVFASVCPPQPEGESLFIQIIHNISIECFSKKFHYKSPNSQKCLGVKMGLIGLRDLFWLILSNFIWGSQHFHKSSVSHRPNAPSETYPEGGVIYQDPDMTLIPGKKEPQWNLKYIRHLKTTFTRF